VRRTPLMHAGGGKPIMISAYGIDAGGSNTQDVYNYGLSRRALGCVILHGATRPNRPIMGSVPSRVDVEWGGTKVQGGVELWTVGTDVAKDYLAARLHLSEGAGAFHFHDQLPVAWFEGLLVEQPRVSYKNGRTVRQWINPPGGRNEPLDLSVYNLAIAHQLGLHRYSALDWKRLRDKLVPRDATRDLFAPAPAPVVEVQKPDLAAVGGNATVTGEAEITNTEVLSFEASRPPAAPGADREEVAARPAPAPGLAPLPVPAPAPRAGRRILSRGIRR
jgi:phage terminase large subunit GpA-like protein